MLKGTCFCFIYVAEKLLMMWYLFWAPLSYPHLDFENYFDSTPECEYTLIFSYLCFVNSRYRERMKQLSEIYHDRPMTAMETAVYWTEYVIRHKGARHLQSVAATLPWYQYLLLDVIGFCLFAIIVALFLLTLVLKTGFNLVKNLFSSKKIKTN